MASQMYHQKQVPTNTTLGKEGNSNSTQTGNRTRKGNCDNRYKSTYNVH